MCHFKILTFQYLEINVFKQDNRSRRVVVNSKGEFYEITNSCEFMDTFLVYNQYTFRYTSLSEIVGDFPTPLIQNVSITFHEI